MPCHASRRGPGTDGQARRGSTVTKPVARPAMTFDGLALQETSTATLQAARRPVELDGRVAVYRNGRWA